MKEDFDYAEAVIGGRFNVFDVIYATAMKLVGNLMVALELESLAEGLVLARKAGLDLNTVMEVVKVADFRSPLLRRMGGISA